ncbi:hypothetical protein Dsin_021816 [Dipteronia sinensis]|uniref:Reverse transcriptase zinc-binding domain-containing protein n=1 Tax=Dipteronia sinensis TaxID=43782 RepID=A0AAE0DZD8_9ROSI|nr:hypothetical protein Dsin_021816 [Dipteronia sinensis]
MAWLRGGFTLLIGIWFVKEKDRVVLAKWVWRFGRENSSLWKRVICTEYGPNINDLQWDWQASISASYFIKVVEKLFIEECCSSQTLQDGLRVVVGDGERVRFWSELLHDSSPLKKAFPRIHALASNKAKVVADFGMWEESN